MKLNPYKFIIFFFIGLIFIGTGILSLPFMSINKISLIDKIFTVTSAVCVTGLNTVSINNYSFIGHIIILILVQIGALGYMFIGSLIIIFFGKLNLVQKRIVGESLNIFELTEIKDVVPLMKNIIFFTFMFEFIGFLILFIKFFFKNNFSLTDSIWYSLFHSISAFCNAGFSLFNNSLKDYQGDIIINLIISLLIISGGLGFIVWVDIFNKLKKKKENLLLHSKIVIFMSLILIFLGTILIFLLNREVFIFKKLSLKIQILVSFFHSVTSRTAGFNTFDINEFSVLSILVLIFLMFIGASPGGTGGGIKTTTFFVVVASVYNYIIGEKDVSVFKRRIDIKIILKSFSIFFVCAFWILLVSSLINILNGFPYLSCLFETVSAFGTVGLSLGITQNIDNFSKILLIITMLVGRIGSLTLVSLLFSKEPKEIKYLEENISVG